MIMRLARPPSHMQGDRGPALETLANLAQSALSEQADTICSAVIQGVLGP